MIVVALKLLRIHGRQCTLDEAGDDRTPLAGCSHYYFSNLLSIGGKKLHKFMREIVAFYRARPHTDNCGGFTCASR